VKFGGSGLTQVDSQQPKPGFLQKWTDIIFLDRRIIKRIKIVDTGYLHPGVLLIERCQQMMANESGAAGNEEVHKERQN
jgi:hypothetical protein